MLSLIYGGTFYKGANEAQANVAVFQPAHCLGGWKNVDNIAGAPQVRSDNEVEYNDTNSASVVNTNAQVFCGGFSGQIPYAAKHERVSVHFSWYIEDGKAEISRPVFEEKDKEIVEEVIPDSISSTTESGADPVEIEPAPFEETHIEDTVIEESETPDILEPEVVEPTPTESSEPSEPTALQFFRYVFNTAHAEEPPPTEVTEITEEPPQEDMIAPDVIEEPETVETVVVEEVMFTEISTTTAEVVPSVPVPASPRSEEEQQQLEEAHEEAVLETSTAEGAYFEVLYTLDGQEWHTLGFVNRIANDVEIEMPIDLFATVEDLKKVQIALHTVERFDSVPKIYLDALWLEVTYDDMGQTELVPPGQRPGDVIFSETTYQDSKAVVVLRDVALETLSNVLSESDSANGSSTRDDVATSTVETIATSSSASTTESAQSLTEFVSTSTLADIINSTGVRVELWLYASSTDSWSRIADDSIISRNPQVKFIDGNLFWVDKNNLAVWRFNPKSGGYDALSFSEGQVSKMPFQNEAGEEKVLEFSVSSSSVLLKEVTVSEPEMLNW